MSKMARDAFWKGSLSDIGLVKTSHGLSQSLLKTNQFMLCGTFFSRTSTTEVKVKLYYLSHTIVISLPLHHHALQLAGEFRAIFLANYTQNQNQSYNLS